MRTRQPRPSQLDPELVELFADDPEGLAVVDAIAATQRSSVHAMRRRVPALIAAVVAIIAVAVLGAVLVGNSRAGVIERALRVVARPAVVHLTLVDERPAARLFDLKSGRTEQLRHRLDEWYDRRHSLRRLRDQVGSFVVSDRRTTARGTDSLTTSFIATYRSALAQNVARVASRGRFAGQPVYWVVFAEHGQTARVAKTTLRPVALQYGYRRFRIVGFRGLAAIPRPSPRPAIKSGGYRPALAAGPIISNLRRLSLPPLRVIAKTSSRFGQTLELRYDTSSMRGKLRGRYLRLIFIPPAQARTLPAVESALPPESLIVFVAEPTQAFARVDGYQVAMQTNLGASTPLTVAQTLFPR
jgi:hypothetical protein